jgi:putative ABC transport system permease protein
MDIREHWLQAFESLAANPRRALASALGVFWGAAATVLMLAWGAGFQEFMRVELGRYGRASILVIPGVSSSGFPGYRAGVPIRATRDDAAAAERSNSELVEAVVTEYWSRERVRVERAGRVRRLDLTATDPRFPELRKFGLAAGRFFDPADLERADAVAVLGFEAARDLFDAPAAAIGRRVRIEGVPFQVIGVFDAKSGRQYINTNRPDNRLLVVPQTTAETRLGFRKDGDRVFIVYPRPGVDSKFALREVVASLARRSGFHPDDVDAVRSFDLSQLLGFVDLISAIFTGFIGVAGTLTLLVGGLGIANYQLSLLAERSVELGVARALGARTRTLIVQVALESLLVSIGAALVGVGLGLGVCAALARLVPADLLPAPIVSGAAAAITTAALVGVALVATVVPALRVRKTDVGLALRAGI